MKIVFENVCQYLVMVFNRPAIVFINYLVVVSAWLDKIIIFVRKRNNNHKMHVSNNKYNK